MTPADELAAISKQYMERCEASQREFDRIIARLEGKKPPLVPSPSHNLECYVIGNHGSEPMWLKPTGLERIENGVKIIFDGVASKPGYYRDVVFSSHRPIDGGNVNLMTGDSLRMTWTVTGFSPPAPKPKKKRRWKFW